MDKTQIIQDELRITTRDGVVLAATLYAPKAVSERKAGVLISAGAGYPKDFYARFAAYGASRGYACLIYDYRGTGGSAPQDLKGCTADLLDWGTRDAPAALQTLVEIMNGQPVFTMGHSFGGQLIGMMDNHHLASGHALIAVGNGFWLKHRPSEWWLEFLFFFIVGPRSLAKHGYLKGPDFWPGVSMPASVFRQWRRWCLTPKYYWPDIQKKLNGAHFTMNSAPMCQFAFTDDPVVTPKSEAFMRHCYQDADYQTRWIEPSTLGIQKIGHSGAFSRSGKEFWPLPYDWLETLM